MDTVIAALGALLATVLATVLAAGVVRRPHWGVYLLLVMLPFNGLVSRLADPHVALAYGAAKDVVVGALLIAVLVRPDVRRRVPRWLAGPVLALLLVAALACLGADDPAQALYGWRSVYFPFLALVTAPWVLDEQRRVSATWVAVAVAQAAAAVAIVTWAMRRAWLHVVGILPPQGDRFPYEFFTAGNRTVPRAFSPFTSANELGLAMVLLITLIVCRAPVPPRWRAVLVVLPALALVFTRSRSAWLGMAAVGVVLLALWAGGRWRHGALTVLVTAVALGVAGVALVVAFVPLDPSLVGHADSLVAGVDTVVQHPLGLGVGEVGPRARMFDPDAPLVESSLLLVAMEAGVVALLLLLLVVGWLLATTWPTGTPGGEQSAVRTPGRGRLVPALLAGASVSLTVLPLIQQTTVMLLLWVLVSVGLAPTGRHRADPRAAETDG